MNTSSAAVDVTGVRLEPVEAVAFEIVSTTCADAPLQPSGRCRVTVGYTLGVDGPQTAQVIATLEDGSEVVATITGLELVPELTVWPDRATTSQVVTVSGVGFLPGATVDLDWGGAIHRVDVDAEGTFDVPVVVPATERTGVMVAEVAPGDIRADAVSTTMLVTSATTRRGPTVIESLGPNVAG